MLEKEKQIDILEEYSVANNAIPLYAFYNYSEQKKLDEYWNCEAYNFEKEQLGITVTPLTVVKKALSTRGCRNFAYINSQKETLPLSCLYKCPIFHFSFAIKKFEKFNNILGDFKFYKELPKELFVALETGKIVDFPEEYYNSSIGILPKRIAIIEQKKFCHQKFSEVMTKCLLQIG